MAAQQKTDEQIVTELLGETNAEMERAFNILAEIQKSRNLVAGFVTVAQDLVDNGRSGNAAHIAGQIAKRAVTDLNAEYTKAEAEIKKAKIVADEMSKTCQTAGVGSLQASLKTLSDHVAIAKACLKESQGIKRMVEMAVNLTEPPSFGEFAKRRGKFVLASLVMLVISFAGACVFCLKHGYDISPQGVTAGNEEKLNKQITNLVKQRDQEIEKAKKLDEEKTDLINSTVSKTEYQKVQGQLMTETSKAMKGEEELRTATAEIEVLKTKNESLKSELAEAQRHQQTTTVTQTDEVSVKGAVPRAYMPAPAPALQHEEGQVTQVPQIGAPVTANNREGSVDVQRSRQAPAAPIRFVAQAADEPDLSVKPHQPLAKEDVDACTDNDGKLLRNNRVFTFIHNGNIPYDKKKKVFRVPEMSPEKGIPLKEFLGKYKDLTDKEPEGYVNQKR